MRSLVALLVIGLAAPAVRAAAPADTSRALIVVGLPGDAEHEAEFATVARAWRDWLTGPLGFAAQDVTVLFGRDGKPGLAKGPATRAAVEAEVASLRQTLRPGDRLWVFFLGHGNHDGEHAYFHLAGPDLRDDETGKLFAGLACREQVFWMTHAASGHFLRPLSAKGRVVITACADGEVNETEFPQALVAAATSPPEQLDADHDGKVSLLELYRRAVAAVGERYAADMRVPTEHAQLDDDGDGRGTENPVVVATKDQKATADGRLAAALVVPRKR